MQTTTDDRAHRCGALPVRQRPAVSSPVRVARVAGLTPRGKRRNARDHISHAACRRRVARGIPDTLTPVPYEAEAVLLT
jgi:hypothetical protein